MSYLTEPIKPPGQKTLILKISLKLVEKQPNVSMTFLGVGATSIPDSSFVGINNLYS